MRTRSQSTAGLISAAWLYIMRYLRSWRYTVYSLVEASLCLVIFGFVEPDLLLGQALESTHDDAVIIEDRKHGEHANQVKNNDRNQINKSLTCTMTRYVTLVMSRPDFGVDAGLKCWICLQADWYFIICPIDEFYAVNTLFNQAHEHEVLEGPQVRAKLINQQPHKLTFCFLLHQIHFTLTEILTKHESFQKRS